MRGYVMVGSNRLEEAKAFYDALFAVIGVGKLFEHGSGGRLYGASGDGMIFGVVGPHDKKEATVGNGTMVALELKSREEVDAFHAKALVLGGTDEGAPGLRGPAEGKMYFAYFRDLDGNKLCAYKFG